MANTGMDFNLGVESKKETFPAEVKDAIACGISDRATLLCVQYTKPFFSSHFSPFSSSVLTILIFP